MICVIRAIGTSALSFILVGGFHIQVNQSRYHDKGRGVGRQGPAQEEKDSA